MQTGVGWCEASRWPCVPGAVPSALRGPHQSGRATARCRLAPRAAAGWAPPPQSQAAGRGAKHRHLRGFRKEKKREKNTHTHTQNSHINSFPSFSFSAFFFSCKASVSPILAHHIQAEEESKSHSRTPRNPSPRSANEARTGSDISGCRRCQARTPPL